MTFIRTAILSCCCLLLLPALTRAESWRGIVPLRSSKADVEKLLGKPERATDELLEYHLPTESVFFLLITSETKSADLNRVLPGTVKEIQVMPKNTIYVGDLGLDEKRIVFIKGSSPAFIGFEGYVDENAGIIIKSNGRKVNIIFYFANAKDQAKCPDCRVDAQQIADMPTCILCPTVTVDSPDEIVIGDKATFSVRVSIGSPPPTLKFKWTVDVGKIVEGQGTALITVDTSSVKGETITATVDVDGIDPACSRTASSSTKITKRPTERPPS